MASDLCAEVTLGHEIGPLDAGPAPGPLQKGRPIEDAVGMVGDDRIGHALVANQRRQGAGVDAADADDVARPEPIAERRLGAVVRGRRDRGMQHDAADAGPRGPHSAFRRPAH